MKNKKLFAILTLVCFLFTLMPVAAMAEGEEAVYPADVVATVTEGGETTTYSSLQLAITKAAPSGTVEIVNDVEVDKWIMFSESLSISNETIITLNIDGLTINGNNHTLTINSIESAGNGNRLFYDAENLNINDLTIEYADGVAGGIGLQSGIINNVTFDGGTYGVLPCDGEITIQDCTFKTKGTAIYYEEERDHLVVTGNTFELGADTNVILLRGDTEFTDNTIISGRTVNVVSGSPVVTDNDFNNVRFKVYNDATATITGNEINVFEFNDEDAAAHSVFYNNTLNEDAEEKIKSAGASAVATVNNEPYSNLQEAIKAAAPSGTVEILKDVTVDEWIMMSQTKTIGNGNIITMDMNGLTINGNGHTLTVNNVESAGNGGYLFDDAAELNISNLTINMADGVGGIDLENGTISNVVFNDGNCIFPGVGDITITECEFNTAGYVIYYEAARDNLVVTNNVFNAADDANIILLRGNETFTDNTVNSGRTVNVVSGSPVVTGNNFNDVRVKVYNAATATIENNIINNLVFDDDSEVQSTFAGNTLNEAAEEVLKSAGCAFTVTYTDGVESEEIFADQTTTVEKDSATPAFDGTPTRSGYTFAGWEPEVAATVTTNSVYTATWTKNSTSYYYGGGTSASVSIASDDNATVKVSDKYASKGETVTITVDVKDGFYAKDVVVTDKNGEAITVTRVALDKWEFTMPSGKVKVDVDTVEYTKEVVLQIGDLDIAVNDTVIQSDVAPFIKNDRTMVPISVIVYALGGTTDWDGETRTVTVTLDGKVLTMVIDEIIPGFGAAAIIVDSRTYVPIGYVADVLGCDVEWIAAARQVVIVK